VGENSLLLKDFGEVEHGGVLVLLSGNWSGQQP